MRERKVLAAVRDLSAGVGKSLSSTFVSRSKNIFADLNADWFDARSFYEENGLPGVLLLDSGVLGS